MKESRPFILHPALAAAYTVLVLAASNAAEVAPHDLVSPLAVSVVVAIVGWCAARLVTRDRHLAGVISLLIVVWFAWYGYAERFIANQIWLQPLSAPEYAVPLTLLLLAAVPYLLRQRCSHLLPRITHGLNLSAGMLVVLATSTLLLGWIRAGRPPQGRSSSMASTGPMPVVGRDSLQRPDIYYVLLDEYTGSRSLDANYGYDNRWFEDSLRARGFVVPRSPRSNYVHTHLALAAILNWQLLDDRPVTLNHSNGALSLDYDAIEDNRTWRYLKQLGYRFVFFPSAYPGTSKNRFADVKFTPPSVVMGEFGSVWSRKTILLPATRWYCKLRGCERKRFPYTPAPASVLDWKFDRLGELPDSAGPLFVFAHFATPHEPYVFDADCTQRDPYWPDADDGPEEPLVKDAYVRQIKCVNRKVLEVTSALLRRSKQPPIIILQGDHGHGRLGRAFASLEDAGEVRVNERIDPFAAYYLPGGADSVIYDTITPVNVLPRIFNHYFDAGIPLLPDATYWSTRQEPFRFTRIR